MVLPQKPEEQEKTPKLITPIDEKVEVIKVRKLVSLFLCSCEGSGSSPVLSDRFSSKPVHRQGRVSGC